MRDPLLVFLKKDEDSAEKSVIDEVAKEVIADDDSSLEYSQRLSERAPDDERFDSRRPEASSAARSNLPGTYKGIEAAKNEKSLKVPKESFIKLSPEKGETKSSGTRSVRSRNTEVVETEEFLVVTLKASHRQEMLKYNTSKSFAKGKEHTTDELAAKSISESKELKTEQTQQTPDIIERAIAPTSTPIVIHGTTEAFTKYNYIPNEEFYAEIRDFNKPTRWNKNVQKIKYDNFSRLEKSLITYDLFPRKFATFLIRTIRPMPEKNLSEKSQESFSEIDEEHDNVTKTTQPIKFKSTERNEPSKDLQVVETLEDETVKKKPDSLTDITKVFESGATKNLDPLSMNPIKFRKELHDLCLNQSHKESLMITGKRSDKSSKTGAVPKSLESFKVRKSPKSAPDIESVPNVSTKRKRAAFDFNPLSSMGDLSASLNLSKSAGVSEDTTVMDGTKINTGKLSSKVNTSPEGNAFNPIYVPDIESFGASASLEASSIFKFDASSETAPFKGISPDLEITSENVLSSDHISSINRHPIAHISPQAEIPYSSNVSTVNATNVSFQADLSSSGDVSSTYQEPLLAKNTNIQYRDIPVLACARRSNKPNRIANLKAYLKNKNWLGYQCKKFKHYKRNETARQQMLLEKIIFAIPQVDAAMYSAQIITTRIEILQQSKCETEESLKHRNAKMKLLMSKLLEKTDKIEDLLETIRCNAVMYTLETNYSNTSASKRLNKVMEHLCETSERKYKSEGELSTVGEDVEALQEEHGSVDENIV